MLERRRRLKCGSAEASFDHRLTVCLVIQTQDQSNDRCPSYYAMNLTNWRSTDSSRRTCCTRSVKWDWNQYNAKSLIPNDTRNRRRRIWWSIKSKATKRWSRARTQPCLPNRSPSQHKERPGVHKFSWNVQFSTLTAVWAAGNVHSSPRLAIMPPDAPTASTQTNKLENDRKDRTAEFFPSSHMNQWHGTR